MLKTKTSVEDSMQLGEGETSVEDSMQVGEGETSVEDILGEALTQPTCGFASRCWLTLQFCVIVDSEQLVWMSRLVLRHKYIQGVSKKRYFLGFSPISDPELGFYFFTCVSESAFRARFIQALKQYLFRILSALKTLETHVHPRVRF